MGHRFRNLLDDLAALYYRRTEMTTSLLQEERWSFRIVQGITENRGRSGKATFDLIAAPTALHSEAFRLLQLTL